LWRRPRPKQGCGDKERRRPIFYEKFVLMGTLVLKEILIKNL
jgi:hypothetical protein